MNQSVNTAKELTEEYLTFLAKFKSFQLSTIGANGQPESSYAPFVFDKNKINP